VPKIISECCELVKLCHINRSSPIFLIHPVVYWVSLQHNYYWFIHLTCKLQCCYTTFGKLIWCLDLPARQYTSIPCVHIRSSYLEYGTPKFMPLELDHQNSPDLSPVG